MISTAVPGWEGGVICTVRTIDCIGLTEVKQLDILSMEIVRA